MEFILALILFFIFLNSPGSSSVSGDNDNSYRGNRGIFSAENDDCDSHHPDDTFHLEDGLDHDVDDDGYCEECDDYHDV